MSVITFRNVRKRMGDFELDLPKMSIEQGYITGFVGENGAGKTTTIKLMMNMLFPDQGEITLFNKTISENEIDIKKSIGYVGEPLGYNEDQKLKDIVKVVKYFYQDWDESLYSKYMKEFQLNSKSKFKELSMGQKKQFALITALAHKPKLLLLDEPTANLDPVARNYILSLLREYMLDEEASIFYSTHVTSDLDKACDYVAYLKQGKLVFNTEREQLREQYYKVKGPKGLLTEEVKAYLINPEVSAFGFEGLTNAYDKIRQLLGDNGLYEEASIEDIMIGFGGRRFNE